MIIANPFKSIIKVIVRWLCHQSTQYWMKEKAFEWIGCSQSNSVMSPYLTASYVFPRGFVPPLSCAPAYQSVIQNVTRQSEDEKKK